MKVIKKIVSTGEKNMIQYPRTDMGPIIGLDNDIKFYGIEETTIPDFDNKLYKLQVEEEWLDEPFNGLSHLGTYRKNYTIVPLSNDIIINNLNKSVGNWIDTEYPLWEQNKHTGQILRLMQISSYERTDEENSRYNWIIATADWAKSCRELRDLKETQLISNGILPSFEWPLRPEKPENL